MAGDVTIEGGYRDMACSVRAAVGRAAALTAEAARLQAASRWLQQEARRLRREPADGDGRLAAVGFRLEGTIEGDQVVAEWTSGGVTASAPLLVRADLVVRLGDVFVGSDGSEVPAALDGGPSRALLTFMRACDNVRAVSVSLGPAADGRRPVA